MAHECFCLDFPEHQEIGWAVGRTDMDLHIIVLPKIYVLRDQSIPCLTCKYTSWSELLFCILSSIKYYQIIDY